MCAGKRLLGNRNAVLLLAMGGGLVFGHGAQWTKGLTIPALALVMTVTCMGIPGGMFRSPRDLVASTLTALMMNFLVLGGVLYLLSALVIHDHEIKQGFFIMMCMPPGVAVIPFTTFLNGDSKISVLGTVGAYLGALVITPVALFWFLGSSLVSPLKLFLIVLELILIPLGLAWLSRRTGLSEKIAPIKGAITNWGFFVVVYTIVGLNRQFFFESPLSLLPVAASALASTFLLGALIELAGKTCGIDGRRRTSLVLLGTIKNYGLAGGIALYFFEKQTAVPAAVSAVFLVIYLIWLGYKKNSA